jgi:hypothetical protein
MSNFKCYFNSNGINGTCNCILPYAWDTINGNCNSCSNNYTLSSVGTCGLYIYISNFVVSNYPFFLIPIYPKVGLKITFK